MSSTQGVSQQPRAQQQNIEPEPRVFCGLPVGGAVGILGSILMICQIFGLFYLSPFMLYFFEISIGSAMMFILSSGAKHRKIAYVTAYMLYISMYTFWVFFLILGAILATVWLVDNNDNICDNISTTTITPKKLCSTEKFTTADVEMVIISCFFLTLSIIVAIVQMRYLMILYNFLRKSRYLPTHHLNNEGFNVQYVVPTPISPNGLPPPPRYTQFAPPITEQNIKPENITATPILDLPGMNSGNVNLGFGNDEEPRPRLDSRPPAYSEVVEPQNITENSQPTESNQ
ncbi:unnamed protein product [Caenorhabditis angaria]|uniref:Uncharacterized protein n=1 Tax=Caenorhabditis angaria TaxID=860376 RepID=A0A9P1MTD9_9PELO|nr:unnamed protein product [Caenorhabditis angaria]